MPVDGFEFKKILQDSNFKTTRLYQNLKPLNNALCFKRVFNEPEEHQRGRVYAAFDPATSTVIAIRKYHD